MALNRGMDRPVSRFFFSAVLPLGILIGWQLVTSYGAAVQASVVQLLVLSQIIQRNSHKLEIFVSSGVLFLPTALWPYDSLGSGNVTLCIRPSRTQSDEPN